MLAIGFVLLVVGILLAVAESHAPGGVLGALGGLALIVGGIVAITSVGGRGGARCAGGRRARRRRGRVDVDGHAGGRAWAAATDPHRSGIDVRTCRRRASLEQHRRAGIP